MGLEALPLELSHSQVLTSLPGVSAQALEPHGDCRAGCWAQPPPHQTLHLGRALHALQS